MNQAVSNMHMIRRRSLAGVWLRFLGSMNLAITLLVAVAVASVIGMVIPQNQPFPDYVLQFGPFWFQVFHALGLYNVYSSAWFVAILAFLVISTSVCVVRNVPGMLREMIRFRTNVQAKSLRQMRDLAERDTAVEMQIVLARAERLLRNRGWRLRVLRQGGTVMLAAVKGASNRLGYLLTHIGLVVILLSGVIDGNLPVQIAMAMQGLHVDTQMDVPASQVPADSRLGPGTVAFRGDVTVPVGDSTDVVFLKFGKGYLVQDLPFTLTLKDFTVERYRSGPPKDFVSRVLVHDAATGQTVHATISDNHPLMFHGYDIYQTSFGDGGSRLQFKVWRFTNGGERTMQGDVFQNYPLKGGAQPLMLDLVNFRRFNIIGTQADDRGPSFTYKIRRPDGVAMEYLNYMRPQKIDGRLYYLSGVRSSPAQDYRFLRIPVGPEGGVRHFMQLAAALHNPEARHKAADATAVQAAQAMGKESPAVEQRTTAAVNRLLNLFAAGGLNAIYADIRTRVPKAKQAGVAAASMQIVDQSLLNLYRQVLWKDGGKGMTPKDVAWLQAAIPALGVLPQYSAPFYLQLTGFHQVLASGLQVTHYPATTAAFLGAAMLMLGIVLMFFVPYRRLWLRLEPRADGGTYLLMAGTSNRHAMDFSRQFRQLHEKLFARLD